MNDNTTTIKLEVPGLIEIATALEKLIATTHPSVIAPVQQAPLQQPPLQQAPLQQPPLQQAPLQQPPLQQAPLQQPPQSGQYATQTAMLPPTQAPMQQPPTGAVPTTGIPTTAVPITHTMDELAVAASQLVNMGKQQRLIEILNGFGVNSLVELPQDKYGAFAGCIKAEGAKF